MEELKNIMLMKYNGVCERCFIRYKKLLQIETNQWYG